jgi:hypothetical protein
MHPLLISSISGCHAVHTDKQQLPPASPQLGQYVPVTMGSYASTVPWGGAVLNCMDPSLAHQSVLLSQSSSRSAPPLPSGRHTESILNI